MLKPLEINSCSINRTLPLAFDESLSYLEELSAILYKLNETIVQVNKNTEVAEHYEEMLQEIEEELTKLEQEYEEFKIQVSHEIDEKFAQIQTQIYNLIETEINVVRYEIQNVYDELNAKIEDIIAGDITIYDPTTGEIEPIQTVINNLYDLNRDNAITCTEFDGIEFTATEFDAIEITAFNFDINGKDLLNA